MKRWLISFFTAICLVTEAKDKAIQNFILDEQTVYVIPVATNRVTTISFPGAIAAMDAAQASIDPQKPAPFLIAHAKGSSFFSVRAEAKRAVTNINIRWNNRTYVLELVESDEPLLSVTFEPAPDTSGTMQSAPVTPDRLLALLDKAKAYPLLKAYHSEAVAQVDYRNYEREPRIVDCTNYAVSIKEAFRFDTEDTLVFRVGVTNKTDRELIYAPNGFFLRVGERTYPQSISDASGIVPPHAEAPAYFAVTGTPNGGRNDISIKNDFYVILNAHTVAPINETVAPTVPAPATVPTTNTDSQTDDDESHGHESP
ncbi:MAG: hypothetical protein ACREC8_11215 [Limisphaerales bacterium]